MMKPIPSCRSPPPQKKKMPRSTLYWTIFLVRANRFGAPAGSDASPTIDIEMSQSFYRRSFKKYRFKLYYLPVAFFFCFVFHACSFVLSNLEKCGSAMPPRRVRLFGVFWYLRASHRSILGTLTF